MGVGVPGGVEPGQGDAVWVGGLSATGHSSWGCGDLDSGLRNRS